jgi:outer membrane receptor protein involved in Fe transport
MHTLEFVREQGLGQAFDMVASVYHNRLDGLIEGVPVDGDTLQYRNVERSRAVGAEFELRGHLARGIEASAAASFQRLRYRQGREIPNSPAKIAQFPLSAPLRSDRLWLGLAGRYISHRHTPYGAKVAGAPVADLTLTTNRLHRDFDIQFGVRNLLNRRYFDPMSAEHTLSVLQREGRCAFVKLILRYGE